MQMKDGFHYIVFRINHFPEQEHSGIIYQDVNVKLLSLTIVIYILSSILPGQVLIEGHHLYFHGFVPAPALILPAGLPDC